MPNFAVVVWNENYRVSGIVASAGRGGGDFTRLLEADAEASSLVAGLAEVWTRPEFREADVIMLSGFMPESVCFDMPLPPVGYAQLNGLLQFELPRRLPCPPSELKVFFRRIGKAAVRVFAIRVSQWDKIIAAVRESGIRCDAIVHPFMTVTEEFAYLPQFVPGLCFRQSEPDGHMEPAMPSDDAVSGDLAETVLKFAAQEKWNEALKYLSPLPSDLKPQRFRCLKASLALLLVLCVGSGVALGLRHWLDDRERESIIGQALDGFDTALAQQTQSRSGMEELNALAVKMLESTGEIDPLPCIAALTAALPENAWIINFRSGSGSVMLTLLATGSSGPLVNKLNALDGFEVDSLRQQLNPDGAVTVYATLKPKGETQP
ncbi:MAG: hypothetical protein AB7F40_09635 [Victivallaceae bacterium]